MTGSIRGANACCGDLERRSLLRRDGGHLQDLLVRWWLWEPAPVELVVLRCIGMDGTHHRHQLVVGSIELLGQVVLNELDDHIVPGLVELVFGPVLRRAAVVVALEQHVPIKLAR